MRYQIVLRPEPEGGYTVFVPALPGCITWGRTLRQARRMAVDAIDGYLASLDKHGEPIPADDDSLTTSVDVRSPADDEDRLPGPKGPGKNRPPSGRAVPSFARRALEGCQGL